MEDEVVDVGCDDSSLDKVKIGNEKKPCSQLKSLKFDFKNIIMLIISGIVNATGVILFLVPGQVIDGGFSGTSVLLANLTSIHVSIFLVCINLPFFIFGFKQLGLKFIICSLVSIFTYSLMSFVFQSVLHWDIAVFDLIKKDILLAAVFGGIISGMGSGLTIRFGGAIDGIEVMAVVFAKKIGITVGQFVMAYNAIIYIVASVLLKDLSVGLYSVISYSIGLKVVDFVVDGFDKGKAFTIITEHGEIVAQAISNELKRGVTILDGKGYYSKSHKTMLYCVVNRFEIMRLKRIIEKVDPSAFVAINDISEVVGNKTKFSLSYSSKTKFFFKKDRVNARKEKKIDSKYRHKKMSAHKESKNE